MELYITDSELNDITTVDTAKSVIWHSVYCGSGDFELYIPADAEMLHTIQEGYFVYRENSDTLMIIEKIIPKTDIENEDFLIISGRSAEGILARRIVWHQTNLNGRVTDEAMRLIQENITGPSDEKRKIPILKQGTAVYSQETLQRQLQGEDLLTCITEILSSSGLGYAIKKQGKYLYFNIINGADRSEGNSEDIPEVIFSEEFDNLITSEYIRDYEEYKNVALVAGEGEGTARKTGTAGDASGLARRELYVDSSISTNDGQISISDYNRMLVEEGNAALEERRVSETFHGEVIPDGNFVMKQDYFLGDIVTIRNSYGISAKVRITEFTENEDENGNNFVVSYESI